MTFYNGYCPRQDFSFGEVLLESCNSFPYLGVIFSTRLSSSKHVDHIVAKCNVRIGSLFSKLPLKDLPLSVVLDAFRIYVLPVVTYSLPVWLPSLCLSSANKLNAVFTKFLKRYMGLPYNTNNAIVHFLTNAVPLSHTLKRAYLTKVIPHRKVSGSSQWIPSRSLRV